MVVRVNVSVLFQVPQRTTSISPALARKNSPGNGSALGPRLGSQPIRARYGHGRVTGRGDPSTLLLPAFLLHRPAGEPQHGLGFSAAFADKRFAMLLLSLGELVLRSLVFCTSSSPWRVCSLGWIHSWVLQGLEVDAASAAVGSNRSFRAPFSGIRF